MNERIGRLYRVLAVGFALLVGTLTYWQVWAAPNLEARQTNPRLVFRELSVDRGRILSADGVVLAANRRSPANGRTLFFRRYPTGDLAANLVGYSSIQASRAGIERSQNDYLTGANTDLAGGIAGLLSAAQGATAKGNDVLLSLSAKAQRIALADLRRTGKSGAVVALEPNTGRVLVMASWPSYDPNLVDRRFDALLQAPGDPLLNRATQGLYPPGSTFKVVTAAAALDSGTFTADSTFKGGHCTKVYGRPLCNAGTESAPDPVSFGDSLVHSYNTTFAQIGQKLGQDRLESYMQRFGFWSELPFDYPGSQVYRSGLYAGRRLRLQAPGPNIDVARTAIGQGRLLVTPLQMALVAETIANGGRLIAPRAVDRIRSPSGRTVAQPGTTEVGQVLSPNTTATLTTIMQQVVDEGTGTAAQIGGLHVAGKTGTAETGRSDASGASLNDAWFIAFAPVESPKIAIAVVVEDSTGFGGQVAAPIARDVIQALQ